MTPDATRLRFARCLFGVGVVLMLASVPMLASIGPYVALAGIVSLAAGILIAPPKRQ